MNNYLKVLILTFTLIFASSCFLFTSTSTPPAEDTPTRQQLLSPTFTSEPTYTPPPDALNESGPFILFKGQAGIWISNPDGSFPTHLSEYRNQEDLHHAISPTGDRMAVVTASDEGLDLVIVNIPSGEKETVARLLSATPQEMTDENNPKAFISLAITEYESIAWQPGGGDLLAFVGAMDGSSADLYLYDTRTGEITRLTSGASQTILPTWSPDGQYVLNYGVSWVPPFGGAILGANRLDGVWAVRVSDGSIIQLPNPKGFPNFVGWQDDRHYITFDSDDVWCSQNLRSVDVATGETTPVTDFSFSTISQSAENGALFLLSTKECSNSLGDGVFILLPGQTTPTMILDKKVYEFDWLSDGQFFFAYPETLISSDGSTLYDPPVYESSYNPAVSKQGYQAWEIIQNQQGRVEVLVPGSDWQTILEGDVAQLIWDPLEGKTLLIALRDGSLYAASYPVFTPRLMGDLGDIVNQAIWVP